MLRVLFGLGALAFLAAWLVGLFFQYSSNFDQVLQAQTLVILVNVKLVLAILCYIAFQVTPVSKAQ